VPVAALGAWIVAFAATVAAEFTRVPAILRIATIFAVLIPLLIWCPITPPRSIERLLRSRAAPWVFGLISSCAMGFAWSSLRHPPIVQDEAAYLLQAHLFAAGRWADPSPPIPVFFEQPHVLVTPRLAAKYPPGHALLLTPGIWLHLPGLVPVLLLGLTGALVFSLARDVLPGDIAPWAGLLAWLAWVGMVGHEGWPRPSYMSEITTAALWLLGWWALRRWVDRRQGRFLVLLAVVVAWGGITRPLTMLAYAIPVAVIVFLLVWRRRSWRQLLAPGAAALGVLALLPIWNWRTTGDWRKTPLTLYTQQYLPWDVPGLGFRTDAPTRALPPEIACFVDIFGIPRRDYTLESLPGTLVTRAETVAQDDFSDWRVAAAPFALAALLCMPLELAFAAGTCVLLMLAYLAYAHDVGYTLYYMETQSTFAVVAGFGLVMIPFIAARRWARVRSREAPDLVGRSAAIWCALALFAVAVAPTVTALRGLRKGREIGDLPHRMFRDTVASLPDPRSIVFVHFPAGEGCGENFIENTPPLETARAWVVYDRGAEDAQLIKAAPDRVPYRFDTHTWRRERIVLDSNVNSAPRAIGLPSPSTEAQKRRRPGVAGRSESGTE
jgi:hypothetical protein